MTLIRSCLVPNCSGNAELPSDAHACPDCQARLVRKLGDIEDYLAIVSPVPGRGEPGPRAKGYESRPPLRLDVVAAFDPRTEINGDGPDDVVDEVPNVMADLDGWLRILMEENERAWTALSGRGEIRHVAGILRSWIGWIAQQPWVDEFARDVGRVHGWLRQACGDAPPKAFARCPEVNDGAVCGGPLMMFEDGRAAQCRTCRSTWRRDQLLELMLRVDAVKGA